MIRFKLESVNEHEAVYTFLPEGDQSAPGRARIDRDTGKASVVDESSADFHGIYSGHMLSKLRELNASGRFDESGIVAWW